MTEKEYREHPAISRSQLWKMSESPEKFKYAMDNPEEPTPALVFGQLFHCMTLQPEEVKNQFAIAPNFDKRTKIGKEAWAEFEAHNEGKTLVTVKDWEQAQAMCESIYKNAFAKKLLQGEKEKTFFWTDEMTGEECKCRTDNLKETTQNLIIVDLKSTDNAETEAFMKSAIKYGYDFQAADYIEGVEKNTGRKPLFVFIAVEKKPPYAVNILQADELFIKRGYDLFREYLGIYHECKQTGEWYGYLGKFNQINNLALPSYLAKEIE